MRTCALFLAALSASAQGVNFYSLEQEADLGAKMIREVLKTSTPTAHEEVREYVERLGRKIGESMIAVPDARGKYFFANCKFTVIIEDPPNSNGTLEPPLLPGGYIIVSEHLILAAKNEAEFAGMLAHAMAHTAERHVTRIMSRDQMDPQLFQVFEGEADMIATHAIAALGLDPSSFADYIVQTSRVRAALIQGVIAKLPPRTYSSSDEFLAIQKLLR